MGCGDGRRTGPPRHRRPRREPGMSVPEGKAVSFVVCLIYYCLTSSDTDIPPPGLWPPGPSGSDPSRRIQYEGWTATRVHPRLRLQCLPTAAVTVLPGKERQPGVACSPSPNSCFQQLMLLQTLLTPGQGQTQTVLHLFCCINMEAFRLYSFYPQAETTTAATRYC